MKTGEKKQEKSISNYNFSRWRPFKPGLLDLYKRELSKAATISDSCMASPPW